MTFRPRLVPGSSLCWGAIYATQGPLEGPGRLGPNLVPSVDSQHCFTLPPGPELIHSTLQRVECAENTCYGRGTQCTMFGYVTNTAYPQGWLAL